MCEGAAMGSSSLAGRAQPSRLILNRLLSGVDRMRSRSSVMVTDSEPWAGIAFAPPIMRVLHASLIDVYCADHIRQARLRGLSPG